MQFVSYRSVKAFIANLERVYASVEKTTLYELESFGERKNAKYTKIA